MYMQLLTDRSCCLQGTIYKRLLIHLCRANILIDRQYNGKLGDFGFALQLPEVDKGRTYVTTATFARTEGYYAPELHHGQLSPKCDVYSYGVVSLRWSIKVVSDF